MPRVLSLIPQVLSLNTFLCPQSFNIEKRNNHYDQSSDGEGRSRDAEQREYRTHGRVRRRLRKVLGQRIRPADHHELHTSRSDIFHKK